MLGCGWNYSFLLPKMPVLFVFGLSRLAFCQLWPILLSSLYHLLYFLKRTRTKFYLYGYLLILDKHLLMPFHSFWFHEMYFFSVLSCSCEGRCLRSFHATNDSGEECPTLGYSRQQLDVFVMILSQLNEFNFIDLTYSPTCCGILWWTHANLQVMKVFKCKNCEYEIYQCFACGRLGSAKTNPPEVNPFH